MIRKSFSCRDTDAGIVLCQKFSVEQLNRHQLPDCHAIPLLAVRQVAQDFGAEGSEEAIGGDKGIWRTAAGVRGACADQAAFLQPPDQSRLMSLKSGKNITDAESLLNLTSYIDCLFQHRTLLRVYEATTDQSHWQRDAHRLARL